MNINEETHDISVDDNGVITATPKPVPNAPSKGFLGFAMYDDGVYPLNSLETAERSFSIGNWFATEEEGLYARECRVLKQKFITRVKELNEGWAPDFGDKYQNKFSFTISDNELIIHCFPTHQRSPLGLQFKSRAIGDKLRKEFTVDQYRMILEA